MPHPSDVLVDVNLLRRVGPDAQDVLVCRHCGATVGAYRPQWRDEHRPVFVGRPSSAGPHLNDRSHLVVDEDVVLRQGYCPGCFTALFTETLPARDVYGAGAEGTA